MHGYPQGPGYAQGPPGPPQTQGGLDQFSWNPRMGPPPNIHGGHGGHGGPPPGYGQAPPPGPPGAPGGSWVSDHQGGNFYSAPMGTPRK